MQATGNKYACKILPGKNSQGDRLNNIIKEVAVMQRVGKHPYTLSLHDAFNDDGKFYLIMDLCTGGELFDQIAKKVSVQPLQDMCTVMFMQHCLQNVYLPVIMSMLLHKPTFMKGNRT